jgi:hypothetical protein
MDSGEPEKEGGGQAVGDVEAVDTVEEQAPGVAAALEESLPPLLATGGFVLSETRRFPNILGYLAFVLAPTWQERRLLQTTCCTVGATGQPPFLALA